MWRIAPILMGIALNSTSVALANSLCDLELLPLFERNQALKTEVLHYEKEILFGYHLPESYTNGYYTRRIEPYLSRPSYVPDPSGHFFRGLFISVKDLANILEKGMSPNDVSWAVGTGKALSFSSSDREASSYIFHNSKKSADGIGVVIEILPSPDLKLLEDPALNSTHTIYSLGRPLGPSEIYRVYLHSEHGLESLESIL